MHVVAGIVSDAAGRVLLAQRPAGKHLAGLWEFPGGKIESDEAPVDALARELREELGIVVESAQPLIAIAHSYPEQVTLLDVWCVTRYSGDVHAQEGQRLAWVEPDALDTIDMPAADRPAVAAMRLPDRYLITPPLEPGDVDALRRGVEQACRKGIGLIQIRLPQWSLQQLTEAARVARGICRPHGTRVLINSDWRLAAILGLDGVHLPARIAAKLDRRPLSPDRWVGVSCHDSDELAHAVRIGADFATLSPLYATPSHPQLPALGWERFADLVGEATLPVFALGGMESDDIDAARMSGAQGIAAVRAFWDAPDR